MEGSSSRDRAGLSVSGIIGVTQVAGPRLRATVWPRAGPPPDVDHITPEDLLFEPWQVSALASRLTNLHAEITGVTLPGYEPMAQVTVLASLVDPLHLSRG